MRTRPTVVLLAVAALILSVTLWPHPAGAEILTYSCIYCGKRATADAIANVILFVPLGATLAWAVPGVRGVWRFGLALSLAIELAQRFIAGRDASVGDVITNALGTLLGWVLWRYATGGARRPTPAAWPLATLGFAAVVSGSVWLLQPATSSGTY